MYSRFGRQQASSREAEEAGLGLRSPPKSVSLPPNFDPSKEMGSPESGGSSEIQEEAGSPIPSEEEARRVNCLLSLQPPLPNFQLNKRDCFR